MSLPGWYPDPAGTPNRFRYWDGRGWSSDTTDNPAAAPVGAGGQGGSAPTSGGPGAPPADKGRRRFGPLILALVALVVLVLVGVFVVRGLFADRPIVDPGPLPSSTVSGWDDSSPTTPPETPTPTPSVSEPPLRPPRHRLPPRSSRCSRARRANPRLGRIIRPTVASTVAGCRSRRSRAGRESATPSAYTWAYDVGRSAEAAGARDGSPARPSALSSPATASTSHVGPPSW